MINKETSSETLEKLTHPNRGRFVAVGKSPDGQSLRLFTGMGGRSEGSKNRYNRRVPDLNGNADYIRTAIHDTEGQTGDASATLYVAHRSWLDCHVASNGEQTEGIAAALAVAGFNESVFSGAQDLYKNEGEKNAYTARITVAASIARPRIAFMGKIVSIPSNPVHSTYEVFLLGGQTYRFDSGDAYMTATYDGHGGTTPNYEKPWGFLLNEELEEDMDELWNSWHPGTRANIAGKEVNIESGVVTYSFRSIHEGRA